MRVLLGLILVSLVSAQSAHPAALGAVVTLTPETGAFVGFKKCYREVEAADAKPASVTAVPPGAKAWFVIPWGDGEMVIAAGGGKHWVDRDRDGDLAEEEAVGRSSGDAWRVKLPVKLGDLKFDALVELDSYGGLRLTNLTRMSGTLRIGDRDVAFSLTDYLANGRYDDYRTRSTTEYWLCDHAHFDVDGNGRFAPYIPPRGEDYSLARGYVFGDVAYSLEVLDHGAAVRFGPSGHRLATVGVNVEDFTLSLVSDEFGACHLTGKNGQGRLPEGEYELDYYRYRVKDHMVRALWWEEDEPERTLLLKDGMHLALAGPLRYELATELAPNGSLRMWSICYGWRKARVMLWPDQGHSIIPTIAVKSPNGKPLYSVDSNYC